MALTNCRSCGKPVARSAKRCPYCGQRNPGISTRFFIIYFIILFFSFIVIVIATSKNTSNTNRSRYSTQYYSDKEYRNNVDDAAQIYGVSPAEIDKAIQDAVKNK